MKYIGVLMIFFSMIFSINAQKKQEEYWYANYRYTLKKKGKQPKEVRKQTIARFIENNYFFVEAGGGLLINTSPIQVSASDVSLIRKPAQQYVPFFPKFHLGIGYHYKFNYFAVQAEVLYSVHDYEVVIPNSSNDVLQRTSILNYAYYAFSYHVDVLRSVPRFRVQPGFYIGLTQNVTPLEATHWAIDTVDLGSNNTFIVNQENLPQTKTNFVFGPSLNLEINVARWFSVNLQQNLLYGFGWPAKSDVTYQYNNEAPVVSQVRSGLLNYALFLNLRFKFYPKRTKQRINDLIYIP